MKYVIEGYYDGDDVTVYMGQVNDSSFPFDDDVLKFDTIEEAIEEPEDWEDGPPDVVTIRGIVQDIIAVDDEITKYHEGRAGRDVVRMFSDMSKPQQDAMVAMIKRFPE